MSITTPIRRRRRVAVATVFGLLSVMGAAVAQQASANHPAYWKDTFRLRNFGNLRCLDMNPGLWDFQPGRITTYDCHGGSNQVWTVAGWEHQTIGGVTGYPIRNLLDETKCLATDPSWRVNDNGSPLLTIPCQYLNGHALWDIQNQGNLLKVRLKNVGASQANWWGNDAFATFDRETPGNFGNVFLWQDTGGANQWFEKIPS